MGLAPTELAEIRLRGHEVIDYNTAMRTRPWPETPDAFRRIRATIGWSQTRLADELGVTRAAIAQWEGGRRRISGLAARLLVRIQAEQTKTRGKRQS
jgi:DNA-binding transcriptional regulator YiaG